MKILYAAGNSINAKTQLARVKYEFDTCDKINVKYASYKKSTPANHHVDFLLNPLLDIYNDSSLYLYSMLERVDTPEFYKYLTYIKEYKPDLIISDLDIFTSMAAATQGIPLWSVSTRLLYNGCDFNTKLKLPIYSSYFKHKDELSYYSKIIEYSDKKFVYSHFGDVLNTFYLNSGFEWVRPYTIKKERTYENIVYATPNVNYSFLRKITKNFILYSEDYNLNNHRFENNNIYDLDRYFDDLSKSYCAINDGDTIHLADCFYNNIYPIVNSDFWNIDSAFNTVLSEHYFLASCKTQNQPLSIRKTYPIEYDVKIQTDTLLDKVKKLIKENEKGLL